MEVEKMQIEHLENDHNLNAEEQFIVKKLNQTSMSKSTLQQYGKIVCCLCNALIDPNPTSMCQTCFKNQVDISEGITKQGLIHYCAKCERYNKINKFRYMRPPWVRLQNETPQMMSFLLSKIKGLNKVKLVDTCFVWTEPHSKRIKLKLTIHKEVLNKFLMQKSFIVEFVEEWIQCDDCKKSFTPHLWVASVQIRQKVGHKRTFMLLEQIVLKHKAHEKAISIKENPEGVDFNFASRSHATQLAEFVHTVMPCKIKNSKQLISHDMKSNVFNYKYTYLVELAPVCKDDIIIFDKETSKILGGIGPVMLCHKISSNIHLIDPLTMLTYEFDENVYWKYNFKSYVDRSTLVEFIVINIESEDTMNYSFQSSSVAKSTSKNQSKSTNIHANRSFNYKLPIKNIKKIDCIFANMNGEKNELFTIRSHLTESIRPGDILLGYDMRAVTLACDLEQIVDVASSIPDIILVKKKYKRGKRIWKLKHLEKETETATRVNKNEQEKNANQYEEFLKDIEEDKPLRSQLNLYKDDKAIQELEGKFKNMKVDEIQKNENDSDIDIKVEDLLDELNIDENKVNHQGIPLVDMKYETKNKKGKVVTINKNKPSKDIKNEVLEKPEKAKRTRTGDKVDEGSDEGEK